MLKKLFLIPFAIGGLVFNSTSQILSESIDNNDCFNLTLQESGNYKLISVKDTYLKEQELRIYNNNDKKITGIEENAFNGCLNLNTLMISYSVVNLPTKLFNDESINLVALNFTGSEEDWKNVYNHQLYEEKYEIKYYSNDEGFIYMWDNIVRPNENSSICDIGSKKYNELVKPLYQNLAEKDKEYVDNHVDKAGIAISKSIKELSERFSSIHKVNTAEKEVSQDFMVSLIVGIALVGMTFISVFYYLKEKQIIK